MTGSDVPILPQVPVGAVPIEATDVQRAAGGDHQAFERLYRDHVGRVYALATRMAGSGSAEDLTQEVFIRAWEKLGTFRGDARFGTWLHRLAVNYILTKRTTMRKREARHVTDDTVVERMAAPKRRDSGAAMDLESALRHLPDGARQIFVLYDVEGYAHDEIAGLMDISVGTSKSQLHRARMLLRRHLD